MKRPDSESWKRAKALGDKGEELVAGWLAHWGGEVLRFIGRASADFEVRWRVEVKCDERAQETGNVAVEVQYGSAPSGLYATSATHWVYFIGGVALLVRTAHLRGLIEEHDYDLVRAGDGKRAWVRLVPRRDFEGIVRARFRPEAGE